MWPALPSVAAILLLVGLSSVAFAADFPEPSRLPARPGLPDPLVMLDGKTVATAEEWKARRRPELKALFQHYMYGEMPAPPDRVVATVDRADTDSFGGKATTREIRLVFGPEGTPPIHLLLVVPKGKAGPSPVFLGLNFYGNHAVVDDPKVALPTAWVPASGMGVRANKATEAGRGAEVGVWSIEATVDRGYAVATFYSGDVAPDHPGLADGVFPHYPRPGASSPGPHDWGAVAAWAWGLQRAVDYLATDPAIDKGRIAVVGHSRLGKAAIVAAAFDERIALVIPHQAGCGGTSPSRGAVGESVKQINDRFPHWFCGAFKAFNADTDRLPFDQNGLMALVAPRPILLTNATGDQWANPEGQFRALKAAEPVYRLLGAGGLGADRMPGTDELIDTTLGYQIRPGKHAMGPDDWRVFRAFADKHLGRK